MLIGAGFLVALARKQAKRGGHSHQHLALQYQFGTKVDIHSIIRRETRIVNTWHLSMQTRRRFFKYSEVGVAPKWGKAMADLQEDEVS